MVDFQFQNAFSKLDSGAFGRCHSVFLFPKGEFTLPCGSPWFEWLSFPCFIGFDFFTPTNRGLYLVGGGAVVRWAYFWDKF